VYFHAGASCAGCVVNNSIKHVVTPALDLWPLLSPVIIRQVLTTVGRAITLTSVCACLCVCLCVSVSVCVWRYAGKSVCVPCRSSGSAEMVSVSSLVSHTTYPTYCLLTGNSQHNTAHALVTQQTHAHMCYNTSLLALTFLTALPCLKALHPCCCQRTCKELHMLLQEV